ncbi:hypothetical protein RA989_21205, partial [Mycobacteroides abscessus subsp. massiliense]
MSRCDSRGVASVRRVRGANPTVLSRITDEELEDLLRGYGYSPIYVSGHEPVDMHQQMAAALDRAIMEIRDLQLLSRCEGASLHRAAWPMIVLRTPKGWTGPATATSFSAR